jgi:hypothetical protein
MSWGMDNIVTVVFLFCALPRQSICPTGANPRQPWTPSRAGCMATLDLSTSRPNPQTPHSIRPLHVSFASLMGMLHSLPVLSIALSVLSLQNILGANIETEASGQIPPGRTLVGASGGARLHNWLVPVGFPHPQHFALMAPGPLPPHPPCHAAASPLSPLAFSPARTDPVIPPSPLPCGLSPLSRRSPYPSSWSFHSRHKTHLFPFTCHPKPTGFLAHSFPPAPRASSPLIAPHRPSSHPIANAVSIAVIAIRCPGLR